MDKPTWHSAYDTWKTAPSKENLSATVSALNPTIQRALASLGAVQDPISATQGKLLAAKAVQSWSPETGAPLPAWVFNQMQPLRRFRRQALSPVKVPERMDMDAWHLMNKSMAFVDKHGREPDVAELADFSGLPVKRIQKIREQFRPVGVELDGGTTATSYSDYTDEVMGYVHQELDHQDRQILEHKTGYGGAPIMDSDAIAKKVKLHPSQVTRRSLRIGMRLEELRQALEKISSGDTSQ